jgi:hypothetical protein
VGNTKVDFVETGWGGVDRIGLAQDRNRWRALVNVAMNFRSIKFWEIIEWLHKWWALG